MPDVPPDLLFAYGTLGPADPEAAARGGWVADAVRGRLFDLGPYPALVDADDPAAGWVEGHVRPVDRRELEGRLDRYEGVDEGLYRRVLVTTRAGGGPGSTSTPAPCRPRRGVPWPAGKDRESI